MHLIGGADTGPVLHRRPNTVHITKTVCASPGRGAKFSWFNADNYAAGNQAGGTGGGERGLAEKSR